MDSDNSVAVKEVRMRVSCSKGTYIRTLCKDIGEQLGVGGCMKSLLRTKVSVFELANSLKIDDVEQFMINEKIDQVLMPVDACFTHLPKAVVFEEFDKFLYNGNKLKVQQLKVEQEKEPEGNDEIRVYDSQNTFTGIYEYNIAEDCYKPVKMFLQ
jgi:tRNA pseudouridine55 synthase